MAPRSAGTSGPPNEVPELELRALGTSSPKATPTAKAGLEPPLELAVDLRALVQERSSANLAGSASAAPLVGPADLAFDAQLLADYGALPRHVALSPLYAYRVLERRRELKKGLAGRCDEAARAAEECEDALMGFAERVRSKAEEIAAYTQALEELRNAESLLRSRDMVLAAEQDAQSARLSQVDARLSNLEAELAQARNVERTISAELSQAQGALGRQEAKLRRAEIELRAAHQRASDGEAAR